MSSVPVKQSGREFLMTESDFQTISEIAYDYTGIVLAEHKQDMVYGRLARRLRALKLEKFSDYCSLIKDKHSDEISTFINSITTNLTSFFREDHHFEFLRQTVIPELQAKNGMERRLRFWSAGCSTGEEPYSLAICLLENDALRSWDTKILATDLDSKVLEVGRNGIYGVERIESLSPNLTKRWFRRHVNQEAVQVHPKMRELISFKRLNLLEKWPMSGPFDVIFCRNVVIYFDEKTQRMLFNKYADMLAPDGYLFIGHSENLSRVSDRFDSCGKTIYRKIN